MLLLAAISYGYDLILIMLFALGKTKWLLSREYIALGLSLMFFISSLFIGDIRIKILIVIIGALAGETLMVTTGLIKIKKILRNT